MLLRRKSDNETPTCQAPVFLPESGFGISQDAIFPWCHLFYKLYCFMAFYYGLFIATDCDKWLSETAPGL